MFKMLDYDGKKWIIKSKLPIDSVEDHTKLKKQYGADLVLCDKQGFYYILEQIIDAEFEDVVEPKKVSTKKKKAKTK